MFRNRRKKDAELGDTVTAAVAKALQTENRRLHRAVRHLSVLNELALAMGTAVNVDDMIAAIVHRAKDILDTEQVMIYLRHQDEEVDVLKTRVRDQASWVARGVHFDAGLCAVMEHQPAPFLTNDPHSEPRLLAIDLDPALRTLLCAPLLVQGRLTGVVTACNKNGGRGFTEADRRLLSIMANHSAQLLETARLRDSEAAYARLLADLQTAREIQQALLPRRAPAVTGYQVAGLSEPAESVGGDYFDYLRLPDGRLGFCVGDVSGKGVAAALLTANLQATLRAEAALYDSPAECIAEANRLLFASTEAHRFATLFYGVLDPVRHELVYCNAGHERPLVLNGDGRAGALDLAEGGLVLGVLPDADYREDRLTLAPGAVVLVYSDGLTDAENGAGAPLGRERVEQALREAAGSTAEEILADMKSLVRRHAGGAAPVDDLTLLVVRRHP